MENYPDVTVIFAMYESEAEDFIRLDAGLKSRITNIVTFDDYSSPELTDIVVYMLGEKGYKLNKNLKAMVREYMDGVGSSFGNARGARKFCDAIIVERSRRMMDAEMNDEAGKRSHKKTDVSSDREIIAADVRKAVLRMKKSKITHKPVGFSIDRRNTANLKTAFSS